MADLDIEICKRFKEARREKGLSQSFLASQAGCKQSALSAFENGDSTKISDSTANKLAEILGVSLKREEKAKAFVPAVVPGITVRGFCPDMNCPSNIPYIVGDRLFFRSIRAKASPDGGKRCACCGEVLELCCPACGSPLNDGACCGCCGTPYVNTVMPAGSDLSKWVSERRAELMQLSSLGF